MYKPCPVTVITTELLQANSHFSVLKSILEQANFEVLEKLPTADPEDLIQIIAKHQPAVIILPLDQGDGTENALLPDNWLKSLPGNTPIIVATQNLEAVRIRALLELGVTDFITPPFTSDSVLPKLWRIVQHLGQRSSVQGSLRETLGLQQLELFGESPSFLAEIRKLPLIARCDVTVMILGETGTGKELIARAVHYLSPRHDGPFVPVDCGAIPAELAESVLFGHERGAFTGAVARNPGLVAAANQGTLFLDEVDGLSLSVQAKLLRFLQQKEYRSLGSNELKQANVRVISATNSSLQQQMRAGNFREDLYYRLNVVPLRLPPLRERQEDIILLARHFVAKYAVRFNCPACDFSKEAQQCLLMHQWPGNIRELENGIEAAVALCDGPLIQPRDFPFAAEETRAPLSFREAKAYCISQFERDYLVRLLSACSGNISEAARAAGKNRRAFWELIRKHKIEIEEFRKSARHSKPHPSYERTAQPDRPYLSTG